MTLSFWGRGLLLWGLVAALAAMIPTAVVSLGPPGLFAGIFELVAILLLFSVLPLAVLVAVAGLALLLVGMLRRRS
jgi:hypothetical protein